MDVKVLGAARQVGRSAFLVSHKETSILLDYGALTTKVPGFPMHVQPKQVRAIVLSHAHLDHSGAAPIYFLGGKVKLHSTPVTAELSSLLIQDFIKISGQYLPFEFIDLMSMNNSTVSHGYLEPFQIGDLTLEFFDAGHIPGSCITSVEGGSKRLLYTGDINGNETNLLKPSWKSLGEADMVITEQLVSGSRRRMVVKRPSVIVSPAGMLVGGASVFYNERLAREEKNAIAIVSFQVPGTAGRTLLDKGLTILNGKPTKVKAEVRRFDFSSHSGKSMLIDDLKKVKGSPMFLTVHGEEESCISLADVLHQDMGVEARAVVAGEEFHV